jgi:EAL domain-containing protein (putative c-di-GMP-specific phosphodiesterase class I)
MVGVEALARWRHPHGVLGAGNLLPRCESAGMLPELTRQMIRQALVVATHFGGPEEAPLPVAVNIHTEMATNPNFLGWLDELAQVHDFVPDALTFEILEDEFDGSAERAREGLDALCRRGYRLSIDDFGTGASGLQRLIDIPCDELKLAAAFVHGVHLDKRKAAIVESTIMMARRMGLTVVLEGVEHAEDLQWLTGHVPSDVQVQGFYLARPMSAGQLSLWAKARRTSRPS